MSTYVLIYALVLGALFASPPSAQADSRLVNISTRSRVETGDNVMIAGFIIGGDAPKTVLVRATGPSLTNFGVPGALADPVLRLFSGQTVIAENDDWQVTLPLCQQSGHICGGPAEITAAGLAPTAPLEAALLITLNPGPYTAIVSGFGGTTGVGLVEVFEVGEGTSAARLVNISTRSRVETGDNVMIAGFIIGGDAPKTVLVRATGPSLTNFGVPGALADSVLRLFSGQTVIAENDDWQVTDPVCQAIGCGGPADIAATGSAPSHPLEAALLITLSPGPYTAIVSGFGGSTGVGLVEVFEVAATTGSFTLTVTLAGTGAGTVTSNPAGINCASTCSASFNSGTSVTLTPSAASGSVFAGWSGGGCSGTGTCVITVTANTTVTATFNLETSQSFTLTVTKAGTGSGTVTSSPAGVTCGTDCSESYTSGTSVTLTSTPSSGSVFAGWGGACSGLGTCTVTISASTSVTAAFSLVIAAAADDTGQVTLSVAGQNVSFKLIDETTGTPVTGLAVGLAIDPETEDQGVMLIVDPLNEFPPQAVVLLGPDAAALAASKHSTGKEPVALQAQQSFDLVEIFLAKGPQTTMGKLVLQQLQPLVQGALNVIGFVDGLEVAAKMLDQAGVPLGQYADKLGVAETELLTQDEALDELKQDLIDAIQSRLLFFVDPEALATLEVELPTPQSIMADLLSLGTDANAVFSCGLPGQRITRTKITFVDWKIYGCKNITISDILPAPMGVNAEGVDQFGMPLSKGSLGLISKGNIGLGFEAALDTNGDATVEVPIGNYRAVVRSQGFSAVEQDVSVPVGGTTLNVTLLPGGGGGGASCSQCDALADQCFSTLSQCDNQCLATQQSCSNACPADDLFEQAECINQCLSQWFTCLDQCGIPLNQCLAAVDQCRFGPPPCR